MVILGLCRPHSEPCLPWVPVPVASGQLQARSHPASVLASPLLTFPPVSPPAPSPSFPGLQLPGTQSKLSDNLHVMTFNYDSWKPLGLAWKPTELWAGPSQGSHRAPLSASHWDFLRGLGTHFPSCYWVQAVLLLKSEIPKPKGAS